MDSRTDLPEATETLVPAGHVARVLSTSVDTIQRLAVKGAIPSVRVGNRLRRFSVPAVLAALGFPGGQPATE